jgi:hypothetical protein
VAAGERSGAEIHVVNCFSIRELEVDTLHEVCSVRTFT